MCAVGLGFAVWQKLKTETLKNDIPEAEDSSLTCSRILSCRRTNLFTARCSLAQSLRGNQPAQALFDLRLLF